MSKGSRKPKAEVKARGTSGAKGGPSTSRGMNYQIVLAVLHTLALISRALCAPLKAWLIQIEPRILASGEVSSFDLGFYPDDLWIEAKLKPTRADIEEWLSRVATQGKTVASRTFHLVYHKGAGPHLDAMVRLIRIAKEASGNADVFDALRKAEGISDDDKFLEILGSDAHALLSRMKLEQVPEYLLEPDVELRARLIAGELGGQRLREYLFSRFHNAASQRSTISINELISEARQLGVPFQPPPEIDTKDLSVTAQSALIILQACSAGVSTQIIAAALPCSESDVKSELQELQRANVVTFEEDLWSMKPLDAKITSPDGQAILSRALSSVLRFIESNDQNSNLRTHVRNVIGLVKECTSFDPKLVASVFTRLDKRLKRVGDKQLVWYVANLSIQAARSTRDRDRDVVDAEARALICGTSWALQRLHKLDKARVDANESYALARDIGLDRTLAFCVKCLGRLCRMEAEALPNGEPREVKLRESVTLLQDAITKFSQLAEVGPSDPEVGDCYSLLGRTYLEQRNKASARASIVKAYELITDETSKDYIDLVILNGDFEVSNGNRKAAAREYDRALKISVGTDPEMSEMRARAFFQKGSNEEAEGQRSAAEADYQAAADIWTSLNDDEFAAVAAWKRIRLSDGLSTTSLKHLEKEPARFRVEAVKIHNQRIRQTGKATLARRKDPSPTYWAQLIKLAKERRAKQVPISEAKW